MRVCVPVHMRLRVWGYVCNACICVVCVVHACARACMYVRSVCVCVWEGEHGMHEHLCM